MCVECALRYGAMRHEFCEQRTSSSPAQLTSRIEPNYVSKRCVFGALFAASESVQRPCVYSGPTTSTTIAANISLYDAKGTSQDLEAKEIGISIRGLGSKEGRGDERMTGP